MGVSLGKIPLLLALVLTLLPAAHAQDDCAEVRLDAPGGSMRHVPVTFQGHVGICYAHAAAQMVDAYRFSHRDGDRDYSQLSSPLEIAVGVTRETDPGDDFDDGAYTLCPSIDYARKTGTADSAWIDGLYAARGVQRADFDDRLRRYQSDFQTYRKALPENASWQQAFQGFSRQTRSAERDFAGYASPEAREALPDADALVKIAGARTFNDAMYGFLEPYASRRPRQPVPASISCQESDDVSSQAIFARIHQLLLSRNPQPIAIKMCRNIFEQGHSYVGATPEGMRDDCELHWPLIIGQKRFGGVCRFLVRNSMGTDDSGYSTDWLPREHGNLWIDEQTLVNNTFAMAYLTGGR